jgi:hypothetical protein
MTAKVLKEQHDEFKRFTKMNAEELAAATAEYDAEFAEEKFRPLTPSERQEWVRAKRRGRPTVGKGAKKISISVEADHLSMIDRCAELLNVSRSKLLTDGAMMLAEANGITVKTTRRRHRVHTSGTTKTIDRGAAKSTGRRKVGA